jgi:hypothetical protein
MRDRAEQQIERMDAEIAANRDEIAMLRQQLRLIAAHNDARFDARVREAQTQLATATGEELKAIRMRIAQEMRRRIERIVFHHDSSATLRIREHRGLAKIDVHLSEAKGLEHIDIIATDASMLTRFDGAGLALLEPIQTTHAA